MTRIMATIPRQIIVRGNLPCARRSKVDRRRWRMCATLFLLPALVHLYSSGQETDAGSGQEAPFLTARIIPGATPYHHDAYYVLTVAKFEGEEVAWPDFPAQLEGLLLEPIPEQEAASVVTLPTNKSVKVWRLTALRPGIWKLPARTIRIKHSSEEISWMVPAVLFEALPLSSNDMPTYEDLEDPLSPVSLLPVQRLWIWISLVSLILLVLILSLIGASRIFLRTKRPVATPLPPWELALRRLEDLRRRNWPMLGKVELYYVDLSAILRYYIQDRYQINAPDMTTPECIDAMSKISVDGALVSKLRSLLLHFDRVKFAGLVPGVPEMESQLNTVADFIRETIPAEQPDISDAGAMGAKEA